MRKTIGVVLISALVLMSAMGCASKTGSTSTANSQATQAITATATFDVSQVTATNTTENAATSQATTAPTAEETAQATATNTAVSTGETEAESTTGYVPANLSDYADATTIALGDTIVVSGEGVSVNGTVATITKAGEYILSGTLSEGRIIVDSQDTKNVTLVLNGVDITCSTGSPIYIKDAKNAIIVLVDGTENRIADGASYTLDDPEAAEPDATLFSKSDLSITGNGTLVIEANYNDGIASKDDLDIESGTLNITAVGDGIRGRDSISIAGGNITINAGADGLKSTNDEDAERGYISVAGGTLQITAGQDGINAQTNVNISGGSLDITSGGGSGNSSQTSGWGQWGGNGSSTASTTDTSAKGIKGVVGVTIEAGTITIDSSDDALHSNNSITINGGTLTIASGDDGMHADTTLTINGGTISISKSYEGIESAAITINDGNIHIVASDDGINVAGGNDSSALGGRPGQNNFTASGNYTLVINGGYLAVNASGDGLDSNGTITMTAGTVIVSGPTNDGNGALDHNGFTMTGGFLVAAGSSGMAQSPDSSSTQYSIMLNFSQALAAGTIIHIESESGEELLTFAPAKQYQSVVLCSPELEKDMTCVVYVEGSSTGTLADGLYTGGTYTAGTEVGSITISSISTSTGSSRGSGRR